MPETRYANTTDGAFVAYQVSGHGPLDLVFLGDWRTHVEVVWEEPEAKRFLEQLGRFARVIRLDKRGTGLSDPVPLDALPSLEQWMDDLRAVLDAEASVRPVIWGHGMAGLMAVLFAATHPRRVEALVLSNCAARLGRAEDYPQGIPASLQDAAIEMVARSWGRGIDHMRMVNRSLAPEQAFADWMPRYERYSASPGAAVAMQRALFSMDVRAVLPSVQAATLVLHRADLQFIRVEHGRYLAEHIPGARYVELPGDDQAYWANGDELVSEVARFLTGTRPPPDFDRVLATVLFTDMVGSTQRAAEVGDHRWHQMLDDLDRVAVDCVREFRGKLVKFTGDGHLATFDGPARAIRAAAAIRDCSHDLGMKLRIGLHAGEIEVRGEDVGGIAVNLAQRVCSMGGEGEVLVTRTVVDLVAGGRIDFDDLGEHPIKGVPGEWRLFRAHV